MLSKIHNHLSETKSLLDDVESKLLESAKSICDKHSEWRKLTLMVKLHHDPKARTNLVPNIRIRENTSKIYIVWVDHSYTSIKRINPRWGKEVKPTLQGYTFKQLKKIAEDWEGEKVWETEQLLSPIRDTFSDIQKMRVSLKKRINKLEVELTTNQIEK